MNIIQKKALKEGAYTEYIPCGDYFNPNYSINFS